MRVHDHKAGQGLFQPADFFEYGRRCSLVAHPGHNALFNQTRFIGQVAYKKDRV